MRLRLHTTILAISIYTQMVYAQVYSASEIGSGYVITLTDSISGNVSVNEKTNSVLVKQGSSYANFSASQIHKAVQVDPEGGIYVYYAGYFGNHPNKILFKAIVDGEIPLLRKDNLAFDRYDEEIFSPYFIYVNGSIYNFDKPKSIFTLFEDRRSEIASYLKQHKLKLSSPEGLMKAFLVGNGQITDHSYFAGDY